MPAPTNTTATTAIDLGTTLPVTVTQEVDDAGTTYDVWYKYTAQANDKYLSIFGFGDLSVYKPAVEVFLGPDTAPVEYLSGSLGNSTGTGTYRNVPLEFPVTSGVTYYFKVKTNTGNPAPANLSLTLKTFTNTTYAIGDLLIPTDFDGLGYTIIARSNAAPLFFGTALPACEFGCILNNGKFAVEDKHNSKIITFNNDLTQIASITHANISTRNLIRCDQTSKFYSVNGASSGVTRGEGLVFDINGTVLDTFDLGTGSDWVHSIAVNPAGTRLYFNQNLSKNVINVWDIVNKVQLADLVTGPASHTATDMVCLEDGTLVVAFDDLISECIFKRYDASGVELNSYTYSSLDGINVTKLARSNTSGHFVAYLHLATAKGRVIEVQVSDDTVPIDNQFSMFDQGAYQPTATATPDVYFQAEDSCPILQLRSGIINTDSGLYQVVPNKRNDTLWDTGDVKMPDPFFKMGLIGS